MLVIGLIVVLVVAGATAYYFVAGGSSARQSVTTTASGPTIAASTSSNLVPGSGTSSSRSSSTGSAAISTYSATFNFSVPGGPGGERVFSNDTVQTYNTVQVASGSFTFFVAASNSSGSGIGHGTLVVTTTGFCSGRTTFPYTFKIPDATTILGNLTIFIGDPTPANFTVPLTCTGPMAGVSTATGNPGPYLSVWPNEITVATVPALVTQHLTGNINYYYNITQTG